MKTNMHFKILTVSLIVMVVNYLNAGFLDGLKKIGGGVVEAAGSAFDTTVNITTSAVQSVSQGSTLSGSPTNTPITVQTDKVEVPTIPSSEFAQVTPPSTTPVAAPIATPAHAPTPQVVKSKSATDADNDDNLFSRRKHHREKKHQIAEAKRGVYNSFEKPYSLAISFLNNEAFIKQLDELVAMDVDGKRYGENARSGAYMKIQVTDYGLSDSVPTAKCPSLPDYCKKLGEVRISSPGDDKFREWKAVLLSNMEQERQFMSQKSTEDNIRKFIDEELKPKCIAYDKAMDLAGKIYSSMRDELGPHHPYVACTKEEWGTTNFGHSYDPGNEYNGQIYCLYDLDGWKRDPVSGRKVFGPGINTKLTKEVGDKWIAHARKWLARNDRLLSRLNGVGIDANGKEFYAGMVGSNVAPFKVYRNIMFGSSIVDVYSAMEQLALKNGASSLAVRGGIVDGFLNGCSFRTLVKPHDVLFTFGAFAPDELPVLAAMTMRFIGTAPSVDVLVEKYGKMDGAVVKRNSEIVNRVWPETEIGQFWELIATTAEKKMKQSGGRDDSNVLKKDLETIYAAHSKAITREQVTITIGGVKIVIAEDPSSHTVEKISFEDTLLSAKLKELCVKQKEDDKKAEAKAKAEAEKKAKAAAVEF